MSSTVGRNAFFHYSNQNIVVNCAMQSNFESMDTFGNTHYMQRKVFEICFRVRLDSWIHYNPFRSFIRLDLLPEFISIIRDILN
ncbi:hypothetical protein Bhyg_08044 [Pseudolycoriella hygida]|uniref:Uncharacterized protein n=1 Tax=Pseudolycoriella hygida TaxID=35572 RepID=A0A9Q0N3R6_9DIPT|nr:hypothetical protein Bhyg_08044 [Pseudolycoriella hygida]